MTTLTAEHRPATKRRMFRHDDPTALDMFSGFGGLTLGIEEAGFVTIMAANHNRYKVEVHEANHPNVEHWIADLVNPDSANYHSARDLPYADLIVAGVSCVNHSQANTQKAYAQGLSLFDLDDPEWEERVTRSERDRATANCVLHYADQHHPRMILIECTTELTSWGVLVPGKRNVGDGTTYQWWIRQFENLGYKHRTIYLNSMFFGVPQSRDRLYIVFWDRAIPAPDLDHRPPSWCEPCGTTVEAVWTWKTGIPPTGSVRYGKQYNYRCPSCRREVRPGATPSLNALDLSNLGTRIGDRRRPLAVSTMARAERCRSRFGQFPAVLMPAKAFHGSERHPWQPMATQTSQQETGLLSTAALLQMANSYEHPGSDCRTRDLAQPLWTQLASTSTGILAPPVALTGQAMVAHRHNGDGQHVTLPMDTVTSTHEKAVLLAVDNYQGAPRGVGDPLATQGGSETMALISSGVLPYRKHTIPTSHAEPMPTFTAEQIPGLLTAAGMIKNNGSIDEAGYRALPLSKPLGTIVSSPTTSLLFSGWHDSAEWQETLARVALEDCYFRMMFPHEIGRGCGFDPDFRDYKGTFRVWGKDRDQVDGYGNAVSPAVGLWIGKRLRVALHGSERAA